MLVKKDINLMDQNCDTAEWNYLLVIVTKQQVIEIISWNR
jgi:hypothetical protein